MRLLKVKSALLAGTGLIFASIASSAVAAPTITNGGFETGDFTGFSKLGDAVVGTSFGGTTVSPPQGSFQAFLTTENSAPTSDSKNVSGMDAVPAPALEAFLGLTPGTLDTVGGGGPLSAFEGTAIKPSSTFAVNAGDTLTFKYDFLTLEPVNSAFKDFAFFTLSDGNPADQVAQLLANTDNATVPGSFRSTGYQTVTYTFTQGGTFTAGFGVSDQFDGTGPSGILLDAITLNSTAAGGVTVPLPPAVWAGFGMIGALAVAAVLRRKPVLG